MRLDHRLGSIETGKDANLVVLKEDIFSMPADKIMGIETECTYFEGKELRVPNPVDANNTHFWLKCFILIRAFAMVKSRARTRLPLQKESHTKPTPRARGYKNVKNIFIRF